MLRVSPRLGTRMTPVASGDDSFMMWLTQTPNQSNDFTKGTKVVWKLAFCLPKRITIQETVHVHCQDMINMEIYQEVNMNASF